MLNGDCVKTSMSIIIAILIVDADGDSSIEDCGTLNDKASKGTTFDERNKLDITENNPNSH